MIRTETWYVLEDGSSGNPRDISPGADGRLVHKDGRAVAYRPDGVTPRSRGVTEGEMTKPPSLAGGQKETDEMRDAVQIPDNWQDLPWAGLSSLAAKVSPTPIKTKADAEAAIEAALARRAGATREMKPAAAAGGYKTRETKAD
jgi:hypothetical protein